jgi:uncharacterized membrane protein
MENDIVALIIRILHLLATVAWIGGMIANFFIYMPAMKKVLDPPTSGKLMAVLMKRFKIMVYISILIFIISGLFSSFVHYTTTEPSSVESYWNILFGVKLAAFSLMVLLAIISFEFLSPRIRKLASKGPSPDLERIQKIQMASAALGFLLGIIIVFLSAAL